MTVKKLDDYEFTGVDLIKVDTDGHQANVIDGVIKTIGANKPVILVEIEQRHISEPIEDVFKTILSIGYEGYFLKNVRLFGVCEFSYKSDQAPYLDDTANKNTSTILYAVR